MPKASPPELMASDDMVFIWAPRPPVGDVACASAWPAKTRAEPGASVGRAFPLTKSARRRLLTAPRIRLFESFTLLTPAGRGNNPSDSRLARQVANGAAEISVAQPPVWKNDSTPLAMVTMLMQSTPNTNWMPQDVGEPLTCPLMMLRQRMI